MRFTISTLGLAAAATALPSQQPRTTTPSSSQSKGFYLIAQVTDPTHDLSPSVNGLALGTAHTGAGLGAAVLYGAPTPGRLFYENGTAAQVASHQTTIITDGGTPLFPSSLQVPAADEPRGIADISVGEGTANTIVEGSDGQPKLVNGLDAAGTGTYLACNATVPYYGYKFITLQYLYGGAGEAVPEDCTPIALVPKCAVLNDLPEGSISSHEFAVEAKCVE